MVTEEIQNIRTVQGLPEIGKTYKVPCVLSDVGYLKGKWIPVMGKPHEDEEYLNVGWYHYHFDVRFLDQKLVQLITRDDFAVDDGLPKNPGLVLCRALPVTRVLGDIECREMVCRRQMPTFPTLIDRGTYQDSYRAIITEKLEPHYQHQPMQGKGDCRVCPHRKTSLNGIPTHQTEYGEVVVCPAHGMAFNVKTRRMVKRSLMEPVRLECDH